MDKTDPAMQRPPLIAEGAAGPRTKQPDEQSASQLSEEIPSGAPVFRPDHHGVGFALLFSGLEESHNGRHALPGGPTRSSATSVTERRGAHSRIRSESPVPSSSAGVGDPSLRTHPAQSGSNTHMPHARAHEGAAGSSFAALRRGSSGDTLSLRSSRAARYVAAGGDISDAAIEAAAAAIHRDALNSRQQVRSRANSEGYEGSVHAATGLSISVLDADGVEVALTAALQSATEQELLVPDALPSRLHRSASRGHMTAAAQGAGTQPQTDFADASSGVHLHARSRSGSSPARPSSQAVPPSPVQGGVYSGPSLASFGSPGRPGLTIGSRGSTGTSVIAGRDALSPRSPAISRPPSSVSLSSLASCGGVGAGGGANGLSGSGAPGTPDLSRFDGAGPSAHAAGGILYGDAEEDDLAGYDEPSAADAEGSGGLTSGAGLGMGGAGASRPGPTKSPHTGSTYSSRSRGRTLSRDSSGHEEGIAEVESEGEGRDSRYSRRHAPSGLSRYEGVAATAGHAVQQGSDARLASGEGQSSDAQTGQAAGSHSGLPPHKISDASSLHTVLDETIQRLNSGQAASVTSSLGGEDAGRGKDTALWASLESMARNTRDRRLRHAPKERVPLESLASKDPRWVLASKAAACAHCSVRFSLLSRKHHCRGCGVVLCADCTPYQAVDMRRICKKCNALRQGRVLRTADVAQDIMHWLDCVAAGDLIEVETRLGLGADVNASDPIEGLTALHVASAYRSYAHHRVQVAMGMHDMVRGEQGWALRQAAALLPPGPLKRAALGELAISLPGYVVEQGSGSGSGSSHAGGSGASAGESHGHSVDGGVSRAPSAAEVYTHHIILQAASSAAHAALAAQAAAGLHTTAASAGSGHEGAGGAAHGGVLGASMLQGGSGTPPVKPSIQASWGGLGKMLSAGRKSSVDSLAAMLGHGTVGQGTGLFVAADGVSEAEGSVHEGDMRSSSTGGGGPPGVGSAGRASPIHSFIASPQPTSLGGPPGGAGPAALSPLLTSLGSSIGHLVTAAAGKLSGLHLGEKAIGIVASAAGAVVASAGGMENSDYYVLSLAGGDHTSAGHHAHGGEGGVGGTGGLEGSSASETSFFASPKAQRPSAHARGSPGSIASAGASGGGVSEASTAVDKMAVALVGLLLREGASVNAVTVSGRTPLHMAVLHGSIGIVQLLLDAGALQGYPDKNGLTPHDYASIRASHGDMEGSQLLGVLDARYSTGLVAAHAQLRKMVAAGAAAGTDGLGERGVSGDASVSLASKSADSGSGSPTASSQGVAQGGHPTTPIPSTAPGQTSAVAKLTPAATNGGNGFISPKMDYPRTSRVASLQQVQQAQAAAASQHHSAQAPVAAESEAEDASHPTSAGVTSNAVTEVLHAAGSISRAEALPLPGPADMISAGVHTLDPAAAALQANLLAVRNWQHRRLQETAWLDSFSSVPPATTPASAAPTTAAGGDSTVATSFQPSVRSRAASLGLLAQPHTLSLQDLRLGSELHTWSLVSQVWQAGHPSLAAQQAQGLGVALDGDLTPGVEAAFQKKLGSAYTAPVGLQAMVQQMVGGQSRAGQLSSAPSPITIASSITHAGVGTDVAEAAAGTLSGEEGGPSPHVLAPAAVLHAPVGASTGSTGGEEEGAQEGDEAGVIRRTKFSRVVPVNPEQHGFSIAAALAIDAAAHCGAHSEGDAQAGVHADGSDNAHTTQEQQPMGSSGANAPASAGQDSSYEPTVQMSEAQPQQAHVPTGLPCAGLTNSGGTCLRPATSVHVPYCHVHAAQQLLRCDVVVKVPPHWGEAEMRTHMEKVHNAKLLHIVFLPTCVPVPVPDDELSHPHCAPTGGTSQACCTAGPRVCGLVFDRAVHATSAVPQLVGRLIAGSAVHASLWTLGVKPVLEVPLFERVDPNAGLTITYCNCTEGSCDCDGGPCKCAAAAVLRGQQAHAAAAHAREVGAGGGHTSTSAGSADGGKPAGLRLNLQRTSSEGSLTSAASLSSSAAAACAPAGLSIRARTQSADPPTVRGLGLGTGGLLLEACDASAQGQGSTGAGSGHGMRSSSSMLRLAANPEDSAYEKALLLQMEVEREHEEVFGLPMATLAAVITSSGSMANLAGAVPSAGSEVHATTCHAAVEAAPVEPSLLQGARTAVPHSVHAGLEILPTMPMPIPMAGFLQPINVRRGSKDKGSKDSSQDGVGLSGRGSQGSGRPPLEAATLSDQHSGGAGRATSADFYIGASSNSPSNNSGFAVTSATSAGPGTSDGVPSLPVAPTYSSTAAVTAAGPPGSLPSSALIPSSSSTPPLKSCLKRGLLGASTDNLLLSAATAAVPAAIAAGATGAAAGTLSAGVADATGPAVPTSGVLMPYLAALGSAGTTSVGGRQERTSSVASYFGLGGTGVVGAGVDSRTSSFSGTGDVDTSSISLSSVSSSVHGVSAAIGSALSSLLATEGGAGALGGVHSAAAGVDDVREGVDMPAGPLTHTSPDLEVSLASHQPGVLLVGSSMPAAATPPLPASQSTSSVYGGPNAMPALPLEPLRARTLSNRTTSLFRRSVSFADVHEGVAREARESADYSATGIPITSSQAASAAAAETAALLALSTAVSNTVPESDRETPVPTPKAVDQPLPPVQGRAFSFVSFDEAAHEASGTTEQAAGGSFSSMGLRLSASEPGEGGGGQAQKVASQQTFSLPYPAPAPTTHAPCGPGLGAIVAGFGGSSGSRPARRRGGSPIHLARTAKAGEDSMSDDDDEGDEGEDEEEEHGGEDGAPSLGRISAAPPFPAQHTVHGRGWGGGRGQYSQYALKHRAAASARPLGIGRKGSGRGASSDESDLDDSSAQGVEVEHGGARRGRGAGVAGSPHSGGEEEDGEEDGDDGSVMSRPTASSLSQAGQPSSAHSRSHALHAAAHQPVPDLRALAAQAGGRGGGAHMRLPATRTTLSLGTPGGGSLPSLAAAAGMSQPLSQANSREGSVTGVTDRAAREGEEEGSCGGNTLSIAVGGGEEASPTMTSHVSSFSPPSGGGPTAPPAAAVPPAAAAAAVPPASRQDSLGALSAASSSSPLRISPPSASPAASTTGPSSTGTGGVVAGGIAPLSSSSPHPHNSPHRHQQTVHMQLLQQHPGGLAVSRSGTPPSMTAGGSGGTGGGGLRLTLRRTASLHSEVSEERAGSIRSLSTAGSGGGSGGGSGLRISKGAAEGQGQGQAVGSVLPNTSTATGPTAVAAAGGTGGKGVQLGLSLGLGPRHTRGSAVGGKPRRRTGGVQGRTDGGAAGPDGEEDRGSDGSGGSSSEGDTGTRYTRSTGVGSSSISSFGTFGTTSAGNSSGSDSEEGAAAAPKARSGQGCTPLIRPLSKEQLSNLMTRSASFQGRMAPVPSLIPATAGTAAGAVPAQAPGSAAPAPAPAYGGGIRTGTLRAEE